MSICVILWLLVCMETTGSSAVTRVFVQKGKDLHLDFTKAVVLGKGDFVWWNNIKGEALVRFFSDGDPIVADNYRGRIKFTGKNYTVILKNLRETDSGVYTANVFGTTKTLAKYNVTVQNPVSPVKLRVDSRSVSTSPDSCNLTVTCSAKDSHIIRTFRRQNQTFSQEEGEPSQATPSGASLSVYLENDLIICNHSNQVSWTIANETIEHLCLQDDVPGSAGISVCLVKTVVLSVGLIVMVTAVISVHLMEKLKKQD